MSKPNRADRQPATGRDASQPTPPPSSRLTRADTVALWHAVNWMELCLNQPLENNTGDAQALQAEKARLRTARQALRKVNKIRKEQ